MPTGCTRSRSSTSAISTSRSRSSSTRGARGAPRVLPLHRATAGRRRRVARPPGVGPGVAARDSASAWSRSIHVGNTATDFTGWADIGWDVPGGAGVAGPHPAREHPAHPRGAEPARGAALRRRVRPPPRRSPCCSRRCGSAGCRRSSDAGAAVARRRRRSATGRGTRPAATCCAATCGSRRCPASATSTRSTCSRDFPEMCVFSSDYPHQEGNADPIELYRPALDDLDGDAPRVVPGRRTWRECFARTGDPLGA